MNHITLMGFKGKSGLSLVELLIVTFILGILASVAIPQMVTPTMEAKEVVLMQNLAALRKAIEIYRLQHGGAYPDKNEATVVSQLTQKTDKDGDPGAMYGPYLRVIPLNPINNSNEIKIKSLPTSPNDSSGWYYDKDTGEIRANSSGAAQSGMDYIDL